MTDKSEERTSNEQTRVDRDEAQRAFRRHHVHGMLVGSDTDNAWCAGYAAHMADSRSSVRSDDHWRLMLRQVQDQRNAAQLENKRLSAALEEAIGALDAYGGTLRQQAMIDHLRDVVAGKSPDETTAKVWPDGTTKLLGCDCFMCEYHRSAEQIERERRTAQKASEGCTCRPGTTWTDTNCPVHKPGS